MRYRLRHLLYVVAVFSASLASGFPGFLLLPNDVWEVVSIHEEDGDGGAWHGLHPGIAERIGIPSKDYIATVQNGQSTQTVNLGDTVLVSEHRLQLPEVGSHVVLMPSPSDTHGKLPVASVEAPSRVWCVLAATFSLLCSVAFVATCLSIRWIFLSAAG